jgi:hypothetical protein
MTAGARGICISMVLCLTGSVGCRNRHRNEPAGTRPVAPIAADGAVPSSALTNVVAPSSTVADGAVPSSASTVVTPSSSDAIKETRNAGTGGRPETAPNPPTPAALVRALGMTESAALRLLFPDGPGNDPVAPNLESGFETDLGLRGRRFVGLNASSPGRQCTGCGLSASVLIDARSRKLVWRVQSEARGGLSFDCVFFPAPGIPVLAGIEQDSSLGGYVQSEGVWLRLTAKPDGSMASHEVWRGMLDALDFGNRGNTAFKACGHMRSVKGRVGAYVYERRTYYAQEPRPDEEPSEDRPGPTVELDLPPVPERPRCDDCRPPNDCGVVEVRRAEYLSFNTEMSALERGWVSVRRIRHDEPPARSGPR